MVPAASMASADSLPLMHAHTYPDLMSFGDAAFPSVPRAAGEQIRIASQTQLPQTNAQQTSQNIKHHGAQQNIGAKPEQNVPRYCLHTVHCQNIIKRICDVRLSQPECNLKRTGLGSGSYNRFCPFWIC